MKSLLSAALLLWGTLCFAHTSNVNPYQSLRKEIARMVHTPELSKYNVHQAIASIKFTVNTENEVVLLDVLTEARFLKEFIKNRLDQHKLTTEDLQTNIVYTMTIVFESEA